MSDTELPARCEIAIVGAGIMGLSIAYQLAKRGLTNVVVIDRGYLAGGASGRNGGGVRAQWSTEFNIRLMRRSIELCREFSTELGVNVWFRQGGYLFLARTPAEVQRLEKNTARQQQCGMQTRVIDASEAARIVPELCTEGILAASYNATDGIVFPWPFLWGYAENAAKLGARVLTHTEVHGIERDGSRFLLRTSRGTLSAARVINATGAWTPTLSAQLGVAIPTWPVKHEICSSEPLKPFLGPMVSELSSGLYVSQSMRGELVGGVTVSHHGDANDWRTSMEFLATYARRLQRLMPRTGHLKLMRAWAGSYDASPDGNPIVGEAPGVPGYFLACGFVGHGFMMAPVVGEMYANWLVGGERHEFFDRFALGRFAHGGSPPHEREDFNIG